MTVRRTWLRYGLAPVTVLGALVLVKSLLLFMPTHIPLTGLFLLPVILVARFGGFGPGLVCMLLSMPAMDIVGMHEDAHRSTVNRVIRPLVYGCEGMVILSLYLARVRSLSSMAASELRYRQMFQRNQAVQLVIDARSRRILEANPAAAEFYGYPVATLCRMHIDEINCSAPAEIAKAVDEVREGRCFVLEFRHRLASGEIRDVEVHSSLLEDGGQARLYSIIHDITDRKQGELALRSNESRLRQSLAAARMASWEWDTTRNQVRWSEGMETLFGFVPGTFDGTYASYIQRVHPEDRALLEEATHRSQQEQRSFSVEHRVVMAGGDIRWIAGSGDVIRDEHGQPTMLIGLAMDITERKRLEEQLSQAQKMEAIGQLAGGIAHDFNNMLSVILGRSELLKRTLPPDQPGAHHLDVIIRAADSSAKLTSQLLTFGRRQVFDTSLIDLNQVVEETADMLRHTLGPQVRIVLALAPGPSTVRADARQVQLVLMNLCLNSRDAMPDDGGIVTIATRTYRRTTAQTVRSGSIPAGAWCILDVSDNGSGMAADIQARLFEPFFTTKPQGKGTGMGLSTVYGIVSQCHGYIDLDSQPGRGSRFTIHLPHLPGAAPPPAPIRQAPAVTKPTACVHILLVDDEPEVRSIVEVALRGLGHRVLQAASGDEALAVAASLGGRISLLITDMVMPGMNGRTLRERLLVDQPDLRTLFMSGFGGEDDLAAVIVLDNTAFLPKPFHLDVLVRKVSDLVGSQAEPRLA